MEISQKIIDYSIWYYLKYYPSKEKLKRKIVEKFWPNSENWKKYWWLSDEEIDYIINERLKNIIEEEEVIKWKINSYKSRWKSKLYIKQKLYERLEPRELIEKYLEEAFVEWEEENLKKEYEKLKWKYDDKKIFEKLIRKWFNYNEVRNILNN